MLIDIIYLHRYKAIMLHVLNYYQSLNLDDLIMIFKFTYCITKPTYEM